MKKWSDITIGQFQKMNAIDGVRLDTFDANLALVQAIEGLTDEEVLALPIPEYKNYLASYAGLTDEELAKYKPVKEFTIDDKKYIVNWRLEDRTAAQFIDLTELTKNQEQIIEKLHQLMAVLCLQKDEPYTAATFEERSKLFQDKLPITIAYPLSVFFWKVLNESLPTILNYLEQEMENLTKDQRQIMTHLENIGDGM